MVGGARAVVVLAALLVPVSVSQLSADEQELRAAAVTAEEGVREVDPLMVMGDISIKYCMS